MASTALEILEDALLDLGAKDPLVPLTAQESNHGLRILNDLMDEWKCNRLLAYSQDIVGPLPVVSGTVKYQFGAGGAWSSAARPIDIESAWVRYNGVDEPLAIYAPDQYAAVELKTYGGIPIAIYYEPSVPAFGHLYPAPDSAIYQIYLMARHDIGPFATVFSAVNLPPGYIRALKLNLSVALAPSRQKPVSDVLMRAAMEAKESIAMVNQQVGPIRDDLGMLGSRNAVRSTGWRFYAGI